MSDYVDGEDNCFLVEKVVDGLKGDLEFKRVFRDYFKKHFSSAGQKAYFLEMLLTVVFAGAIDGIFQARKLSRVICRDTVFIYLVGEYKPVLFYN